MIDFLGFLYGIAKDIKEYLDWDEEGLGVDRDWLDKSGFRKLMEAEGYNLRWVVSRRVESIKLDGYEIIYKIDKTKRVKYRLERQSRSDVSVLMGKSQRLIRYHNMS